MYIHIFSLYLEVHQKDHIIIHYSLYKSAQHGFLIVLIVQIIDADFLSQCMAVGEFVANCVSFF